MHRGVPRDLEQSLAEEENRPGTVRRAELPVDSQAPDVAVEAEVAVRVVGPHEDRLLRTSTPPFLPHVGSRERPGRARAVTPICAPVAVAWLAIQEAHNCLICAHGGDIGRDPREIALFSRVALTADDFAATTALAVEDWIS